MRKFFGPHLLWLTAIIILAALLTHNLWSTRAWIETHDGIYHLIRQEVFTSTLRRGVFPVRWAGTLDHGFGLPLFNYIYPGPYLLGAPFSLLGLNPRWVIKLVEIGLYVFGAIGMYFLFSGKNKFYATLMAALYLTTPYLLLNIFVRGALGEQMAIACMPWILLSLHNLSVKKKLSWYHPLPYFLMFIAHNFLSFLFLPIYAIVTYFKYSDIWKLVLKSIAVSLGLSSFFVLPMIFEQKYLYSVVSQDFTFSYLDHFIYPVQLLFSKWGNGYSFPGLSDGISFSLGLTSLVILGFGTFKVFQKRNSDLTLWLVLTALIIFFTLPVSAIFWKIISPLQLMQFPWRLLSFTVITIPFIAFNILTRFKISKVLYLAVGLLFLVSLCFGFRYTTPFYFQNNEQISEQLYLYRDGTTTSSRQELLPKWVEVDGNRSDAGSIAVDQGSLDITNQQVTPE
jgi:hypothetical protein